MSYFRQIIPALAGWRIVECTFEENSFSFETEPLIGWALTDDDEVLPLYVIDYPPRVSTFNDAGNGECISTLSRILRPGEEPNEEELKALLRKKMLANGSMKTILTHHPNGSHTVSYVKSGK